MVLRKVLWIAGKKPDDMTDDKFANTAKILASKIGGELVSFGTSFMIIGGSNAEKNYKNLQQQLNQKQGDS